MKDRKTVAYLVIKNDSILYEKYYDGFGIDSKSNSFSVAKSVVSALMVIAIQEGAIKGLDQKVVDFIPELKGPYADQVTVGDLSSMASGQKWSEEYYNPFFGHFCLLFCQRFGCPDNWSSPSVKSRERLFATKAVPLNCWAWSSKKQPAKP